MGWLDSMTATLFHHDAEGRVLYSPWRFRRVAYELNAEQQTQVTRFVRGLLLVTFLLVIPAAVVLFDFWAILVVPLVVLPIHSFGVWGLTRHSQRSSSIPVTSAADLRRTSALATGRATYWFMLAYSLLMVVACSFMAIMDSALLGVLGVAVFGGIAISVVRSLVLLHRLSAGR